MDSERLKSLVSKINWFHTIDLGDGVVTNGLENTPDKLIRINLPTDLSGQSVLDIGAWDGFFSFEAERRGARRVVATDSFVWTGHTWGSKHGFDLVRKTLGSKVEDKTIDVMELSPENVGTFDLVFFLGVLYHLRHPFLALEKVSSVTAKLLILETVVDMIECRHPVMKFYPGHQLNNDNSNWWAPNVQTLTAMLKDVGFTRIEIVTAPKSLGYRIARSVKQFLFEGKNPLHEFQRDRVVVHAWK